MQMVFRRRSLRSVLVILLTLALIVGGAFTTAFSSRSAQAAAADEPKLGSPYPWSKVAGGTTGNFIHDSFPQISVADSGRFENVSAERLFDILKSGTPLGESYYILFGGPRNKATQQIIAAVNEKAKAAGITKIYLFNPVLDDYQLDITDAIAQTTFKGGSNWKIKDIWTAVGTGTSGTAAAKYGITDLYGDNGAIDDIITGFKVKDALPDKDHAALFSYSRVSEASANGDGVINAAYDFRSEDAITESVKTDITDVFKAGTADYVPSAIRTEFQFFTKVWGAGLNNFNYNSGSASSTRTGKNDYFTSLFPAATYGANGESFRLKSIDTAELFNLLNSPGDHQILYAIPGCHNSQALIGKVAEKAKAEDKTVYVYDGELGGAIRFGENTTAAAVATSTANGWLGVRQPATTANISYLYGELVKYFGTEWVTTNATRGENSISYYKNGAVADGDALTVNPYTGGNAAGAKTLVDGTDLSDTDNLNARRLQIPMFLGYNKDVPNPVTPARQVIHEDSPVNPGPGQSILSFFGGKTYLEYMLELVWVSPETAVDGGTAANNATGAQASPNSSNSWDPIKTESAGAAVRFAAEAVASLGKPFIKATDDHTSGYVPPTTDPVPHVVTSHNEDELFDDRAWEPEYGDFYTLYKRLPSGDAAFIDISDNKPSDKKLIIPAAMQDSVACDFLNVVELSTVDEAVAGNRGLALSTADEGESHRHPALYGNKWVTDVSFENNSPLVTIGDNVFRDSAVANIDLPNKLAKVGASAFEGSKLNEILLPASVTSTGDRAFAAPNLTKIIFEGNTPPSFLGTNGTGAFAGLAKGGTVYYPEGANYEQVVRAVAAESGGSWTGKSYKDLSEVTDKKPTSPKVTRTQPDINAAAIAKIGNAVYSGKAIKPAVKVTLGTAVLKNNTDYSVVYTDNKKIGTATVTVNGKGEYTGKATARFKIVPKAVSVKSLKGGKKSFTIQWKKAAGGITKYEVRYRPASAKKWRTVSLAAKSAGKTVKSLKTGKKYQVQIRAYKLVSKTKYPSAWSKTRTVKTK